MSLPYQGNGYSRQQEPVWPATLLSGLVSMALVKDGYLPHKGTPFGQLHLCHTGPMAVFPGQGEGQGPQVWVLGCAVFKYLFTNKYFGRVSK